MLHTQTKRELLQMRTTSTSLQKAHIK